MKNDSKKTIFITGSTDGIGKLAAVKMAQEGHHTVLHGRNPDKLEAVIAEIKGLTQNEKIQGFVADFSDLKAVRLMAQEVIDTLPNLDVLINNAGIYNSPRTHNDDGFDMRFTVNYFAPYILSYALLPLLRKGINPRLINLSSAAQAPISYEVLRGKAKRGERETYAQSKLAITMWSFYLANKEAGIDITALNPGSLLNTNMVREAFGHHWSSADKGASIIYNLAVSDEHLGKTGLYFDNDRGSYGPAHGDAYDEVAIEALISETKTLLGT